MGLLMDEAQFIKDFAKWVHAHPRAYVGATHQLAMMNIVSDADDDMTDREFQMYRIAVVAIMPPRMRQGVIEVLRRDLGRNKIVTTDRSIKFMIVRLSQQ